MSTPPLPPETALTPPAPSPPQPTAPTAPSSTPGRAIPPGARHTRISHVWAAVVGFFFTLLLLLVFILQNGQRVEVHFFALEGALPLAVAMLLSAVAGALLTALAAALRILQLRRADRATRKRS